MKTVYFDLGNVLLFFSIPKMIAQIADCTGLPQEKVHTHFFQSDLREKYEKGHIDTKTLYDSFVKKAPKPFTLSAFRAAYAEIFTPNKEAWEIVEELKQQGIRLILLSNTSECHFSYAKAHYPILNQFDHHILSFELGVWKPDKAIFEKALEQAHCLPEECFYIDDIPEFIESAQKAGLPGTVFLNTPQLKEELRKFLVS